MTRKLPLISEKIRTVESVCPECLDRISGRLVRLNEEVRLEKQCPEHGNFSTVIWRGKPKFSSWFRPKIPYYGGEREQSGKGCPFDCGLCEDHSQRTCTALVEVTSRCNLHCPVCFADSGTGTDIDLDTINAMFSSIMEKTDGCNLQISGGEPTVRDDLPTIVQLAVQAGFTFIQLNTNGLRLAREPELAMKLRDAGLSSVFLQFDGTDDAVYRTIRGRDLLAAKCRAVENLSNAGIGIVLVPTLVRGVNTDQLWDIVRFGLERQPHVRGVHFQPMSYFGRFPQDFEPDHVTLPEVMSGLAAQSRNLIRSDDFRPPGCEHSLCSFSAKYLIREDNSLLRLGSSSCDCTPIPAEEGALKSIGVTARQWQGVEERNKDKRLQPADELSMFLQRARTHTFSLTGMAFQDCWSLNLERLRGCCIHVARPDGRLIPFCSFNLTSRSGSSLHRSPTPSPALTTVDPLTMERLQIQGTMSRERLEQEQMRLLRQTVQYVQTNSNYYHEELRGIDVDELNSVSDLEKLPLLTPADIPVHGHRLLCVSQSRVARVVTLQTSGSTGAPKRFSFSEQDLDATSHFFHKGMLSLLEPAHRVLVLLPCEQEASVGRLLIDALKSGCIHAEGMWPPETGEAMTGHILGRDIHCVVGLPQQLLAVSELIPRGQVKTMLLCSDYAPPALRRRIEENCGCSTFLHYGTTESGLGGGVECSAHDGCHLRESDLLVEIVDPATGKQLPDGVMGEIVFTTLQRDAMPLLRYRTGDIGTLDRSQCVCGGITARLKSIQGRMTGCMLKSGTMLYSRELDDHLFDLPGLLDYRARLDAYGVDRLHIEYQAAVGTGDMSTRIRERLRQVPAIKENLEAGTLILGTVQQVESFTAVHTFKRTITDQRTAGENYAVCS